MLVILVQIFYFALLFKFYDGGTGHNIHESAKSTQITYRQKFKTLHEYTFWFRLDSKIDSDLRKFDTDSKQIFILNYSSLDELPQPQPQSDTLLETFTHLILMLHRSEHVSPISDSISRRALFKICEYTLESKLSSNVITSASEENRRHEG